MSESSGPLCNCISRFTSCASPFGNSTCSVHGIAMQLPPELLAALSGGQVCTINHAHDGACVGCLTEELNATRAELNTARAEVKRLREALVRSRHVIAEITQAEDERNKAAFKCVSDGLIDRECSDDCPQDDTCDCPGTELIGKAINRRNFHEGDCLRAIDAALAAEARDGDE